MRQVACPVALHPDGDPQRIAVFEHPLAGRQLVKGGIKDGEPPQHAAARELFEESGLETRTALLIGTSADIQHGEMWHFALCRVAPPVRERWQHHCADDGGHLFRFSWMKVHDAPLPGFEARYLRAFDWLRRVL